MKDGRTLVAQQDIDEATRASDRVAEAQVSTAKATLAAAHEQLAVARAGQNKTKTMFGYARITAPFAGVITKRYADTGAMIQAGTASQSQAMPLVRLSENSVLRLVIPGARIGGVATFTSVSRSTSSVAALDPSFPGTVIALRRQGGRADADDAHRGRRAESGSGAGAWDVCRGCADRSQPRAACRCMVPVEAVDHEGDTKRRCPRGRRKDHQIAGTRPITLGLETTGTLSRCSRSGLAARTSWSCSAAAGRRAQGRQRPVTPKLDERLNPREDGGRHVRDSRFAIPTSSSSPA